MYFSRIVIVINLVFLFDLTHVQSQPPVAEFSADVTTGCYPITVNFSDLSTNNPTAWFWDFGNSNTSVLPNPSAVYSSPGSYTVKLIAYNTDGSDTIIKTAYIRVFNYPSADFTADNTYGCDPLTVQFTDLSVPTSAPILSWYWDFGDGNFSSVQSPTYIYQNPGIFSVGVSITDTNGCTGSTFIPNYITIASPPVLSFAMDDTASCNPPLTVAFTNNSVQGTYPIASWDWNFGDGFNSTAFAPQHTYNGYGSFTVQLTATDTVGCSVTLTVPNAVGIGNDTTDFTYSSTRTCSALTVSFSGTSTGTIISWSYDFGDGSPPGTTQNVTHVYPSSGQFQVILTAINSIGCQDTVMKTISYLKVEAGFEPDTLYACFYPFTVNFNNTTVGTPPLVWAWDFSYESTDGFMNQSTMEDPSYTYWFNDTFDVMLLAIDVFGCRDSITLMDMGDSIWFLDANASFGWIPYNGCIPLAVNFTDASSPGIGTITGWQWDFDDPASGANNFSTLQNPSHTFITDGDYDVKLTISTDSGCIASSTNIVKAGYPPTGVTLNKSTSIACHGEPVDFSIVSADPVNDGDWDFGDGTIYIGVGPPRTHEFQDTGILIIAFTPKYNGCPGQIIFDTILILPPKPIFTANPTFSCRAPAEVTFTNNSWAADSWYWDFGDGTPIEGTLNPVHTYLAPGQFSAKLVVLNSNGCRDSTYATINIPQPTAAFTATPQSACVPAFVSFTESSFTYISFVSQITAWSWDFGNGTFSTQENPSPRFYSVADTFTISLIVTDNNGCKDTLIRTDYITIYGTLSNFTANINTGCSPLVVNFSDQSTTTSTITSWLWTFGDGTPNGTTQNPTHTYSSPGNFNVSLKATDIQGCSTTMFKNGFISATKPVVQYSHPSRICLNEGINFNNTTTAGLSYLWTFGDGDTSFAINPVHYYSDTGIFDVTLVATGINACTDTGTSQVEVVPIPVPDFAVDSVFTKCPPLVVKFTDLSSSVNDSITAWKWDFNDGYFAYVPGPVHTFSYPDTFDITLIVTNSTGCSDTLKAPELITVKGPVGNFYFTPDSGCFPLTATFTAVTSQVDQYTWDFGDGVIDTVSGFTATHTYPIPGLPNPQLSITDSLGCKLPATPQDPSWLSIDKVIAGFSAFPSTLYTPFCPPDTVWFNDTTSVLNDSSMIIRWQWDFGDGTADSVQNPWHVYDDTGTYTVSLIATSLLGCPGTASRVVKVILNDTLVLKAAISDSVPVSCFGMNDGEATVSQQAGTGPFSYLWSPSAGNQATQTATALVAGTHSVTISDFWGCSDSATVLIESPTILAPSVPNVIPAGCFGDSTGVATVSVSGGTPPYTYLWSPAFAGTGDTAINLPAQNYSVTISDNNGCDTVLDIIITEPLALTASATQTDVSCWGGSDGSVTAMPSGGTAPYSYLWNDPAPAQITQTATGLTAGTWTVTVTDIMNCSVIFLSDTITEPILLTATAIKTDVSCFGDSTGTAVASASGGSSPYSFLWDDPTATAAAAAANLPAGTWTVTVTDSLNCAATASVLITEPPLLSITTSQADVLCNGDSTATATATAVGGTPPYSYAWNDPAPAQMTQTATGLTAGSWTVTVTDSLNCTETVSVLITEPDSLFATITITNVSCFGDSDGIASAVPTGGTPPYSYLWDDPSPAQVSSTATGLFPGTWTLTLTDSFGCTAAMPVVITQPAILSITLNSTDISCFGENNGNATAIAVGGTAPYSYLWNNPAPVQITQTVTGLSPGTWSVTVTDSLGCDTTASFLITEPPIIAATAISTDVSCFSGNDGTATATASGGSPPYSYLWNDPAPAQSTQSATGLTSGTWFVTVTDSLGCDTIAAVTITEPLVLSVTTSQVNVTCNGGSNGSATLTINGGTPPYSYVWNDPAPAQITQTATGLTAGTWNVTVSDSLGCDTVASVIITEPVILSISITKTDVSCYGDSSGNATAFPAGGTAPFTYVWNDPPPAQSTQTVTGLPAGIWIVTVTDAKGCTAVDTVTITQPLSFTVTITKTDVICFGDSNGTAIANPSGGITPYTYLWNDPAPAQNTKTATGLAAGTWRVTVTDNKGCTASAQVVITQPALLTAGIIGTKTKICLGATDGALSSQPSGGTPPYTYLWLPGNETTISIGNLQPGEYILRVTDANNCIASDTAAIIELSLLMVSVSVNGNDTVCVGDTRNLTAIGMGTIPPYSYLWSDGLTSTNQNPITVSPDTTDSWFVTVTDPAGCTAAGSVTLYMNFLTVTAQSSGPVCTGLPTNITALASGTIVDNNNNYSYQWSTGNTGSSIAVPVFSPTDIVVTVTDGCSKSNSDTITLIPDPVPVVAIKISGVAGCPPFEITFSDTVNDIAGSIHSWDFGDGNSGADAVVIHTFNNPGFYYPSVTVISPAGCSVTSFLTGPILVYAIPNPYFEADPYSTQIINPTVTFTNLSSIVPVTQDSITGCIWDFEDGDTTSIVNPTHNFRDTGSWDVKLIAITQYGCRDTFTRVIRIEPFVDIKIPNAFTPNPSYQSGGIYDPGSFDNDIFFPITKYIAEYLLLIYNRWGELVFESTDLNIGWDGYYKGRICQEDTYIWRMKLKWTTGEEFFKVGPVLLIR